MSKATQTGIDRRKLLIGAGLVAAVVIPAGIYGIPRLVDGPVDSDDKQAPMTADELALVAAMSEGIIPRTDTAGAIEAGVPQFVALLFDEWMMPEEQAAFRKGLEKFDTDAKSRFGKKFAKAPTTQQVELLRGWDEAVTKARASGATDLPPFAKFKSVTVIAYYTSEKGQEEELRAIMDAGQNDPNGPVMMPVPFNI
eukprot:TRINITY_DN4401_c0_g1_i3.p3 TRINITY_DN4401_c0_g1~~TRINITY_DN4401_c0_g1_i3.p3  ORF type:complete len:197 (-),score=62.97 TRINITY_DN4401_c0_g1_i3:826-1416(-)